MKHLSCEKAGFMSLSCESTGVTDETSKRDIYVAYVWRCKVSKSIREWGKPNTIDDNAKQLARVVIAEYHHCQLVWILHFW